MPHLHLDLRQATSHLVHACLKLQPQRSLLRFALPAWTPGSYLIRDYVRQLEGLEVRQAGQVLEPRRIGVASWELELPSLDPVAIHYRIAATELTVRTCHLNDEHGFLALAAVALEVEGERWTPHRLSLALPPGWRGFVPLPSDSENHWRARDFDQLIDSPVEAGPHREHRFTVAGVPHRWVSWGSTLNGLDLVDADPGWLEAVERVCLACCRAMGVDQPPCASDGAAEGYLFVLHLTDSGYGGLEHDHSCVLQFGRRTLARPEGRRKLLQLVAHEYLHQWNVRRLRPAELTPYRYGEPAVLPSLWFAEGVTSYLDQLLPHAAGLTSEKEVIDDLGSDLSRYLLSPGRAVQSLRESSQEAWVKLYKPDAYSPNSQISYYLKGAVLALVLDLRLREVGSTLLAVLRELWRRFGVTGRGYQEADLIEVFARHCPQLGEALPGWLRSLDDPLLEPLLAPMGLRLQVESAPLRWCGWELEHSAGELRLRRVLRDSPAERAGLMIGDELLAVEGLRVRRPDDLEPFLTANTAACSLHLLCSRDGVIQQRQLEPESPRPSRWWLEPDPDADAAAAVRRTAWLQLEPAS